MVHEGCVIRAGVITNCHPVICWVGVIPHPHHSTSLLFPAPSPHCSLFHSIPSPLPPVCQLLSPLLSVSPSPHPCHSVLVIPHPALSSSHPSSPCPVALTVSVLHAFSHKGSRVGIVVFTPSHHGLIPGAIVP